MERENEYTQTLVKRNLELEEKLALNERLLINGLCSIVFDSAVGFDMIKESNYYFFNIDFLDTRIDLKKIYREVIEDNFVLDSAVRLGLFGRSEPYIIIGKLLQEYQMEFDIGIKKADSL